MESEEENISSVDEPIEEEGVHTNVNAIMITSPH
jgi:hypothetical protein